MWLFLWIIELMDKIITNLLPHFQILPAEWLTAILFAVCIAFLLVSFRLFGKLGVVAFAALAIVVANIQVLKTVSYIYLPQPLALGTVCFTMTLLASDLLNEHYGPDTAKQAVLIGFLSQLFFTIMLSLTLGFKPAEPAAVHNAMLTLFTPSLRLLIASLVAYILSQLLNIWLFHWLSDMLSKRFLWLRSNASNIISGLLDGVIFSWLAWVVLAPTPVHLDTLFWTYILGGFIARILVSILTTPFLYLTYKLKRK